MGTSTPEFAYGMQLPKEITKGWSCRAIHETRVSPPVLDIVFNRQTWWGYDEKNAADADELLTWINKVGVPRLRKAVAEWELQNGNLWAFGDGIYQIDAMLSYGYIHVRCYKLP
jgi:hypothetical protein